MPSAVIAQGLPQRVLRKKFAAADLPALTETELFGAVPAVPCKGYGTVRFWIGGPTTQAGTITVYTRPEKNVAPGSTSFAWAQVSAQAVAAGATTPPAPVNINADHVRVTWTAGAAATIAQIEITLFP